MRGQDISYSRGLVRESGLRQMTRWGLGILAIWAVVLIVWALLWPDPYAGGWWLVLQLFAVGRTVCAYEGVRLGFSNTYLLLQGGTQDIGVCLLAFPWVVRFHEKAAHHRIAGRILGFVMRAAERNQDTIRGFGVIGLFLFAFFPISGTGTLVGCVLGYLLGMPIRVVLPTVIGGHLACLSFLLVFFEWLEPVLQSVNESVAQYFAWILLAAIVLLGWLYGVIKKHLARSPVPCEDAPPAVSAQAPAEGAD